MASVAGISSLSDPLMRSSTSVSFELGRLQIKYTPLQTWLAQQPLTIDLNAVEALSSFFSDFLYQRTFEMHLDHSLLQEIGPRGNEMLGMVLKMRCHVIESFDNFLDPLLEKMAQTRSLVLFLQSQSEVSASKKTRTAPRLQRIERNKKLTAMLQAPEIRKEKLSSQITTGAETSTAKKLKAFVDAHRLSRPKVAQIEISLNQHFNECLVQKQSANDLRMQIAFKALSEFVAKEQDVLWQLGCLRGALPLLQSLVLSLPLFSLLEEAHETDSDFSSLQESETSIDSSEEAHETDSDFQESDSTSGSETPIDSSEEAHETDSDFQESDSTSESETSSDSSSEEESIITDQDRITHLRTYWAGFEPEVIRTQIEALSEMMQGQIQNKLAIHYKHFLKVNESPIPDRNWAKIHLIDSKRLSRLFKVLVSLSE